MGARFSPSPKRRTEKRRGSARQRQLARVVHLVAASKSRTTMNLPAEWAGQTSEDRRATVLLRHEHEALLDLFRHQRKRALEPRARREALDRKIVALIELIDRIEREVFFPALPSQYGALVRSFVADQDVVARCLAARRRSGANVARAHAHGERLERLAREHLADEEALLFTAFEREHPDLNRTLYDRLVAARVRLTDTPSTLAH
jgi:hypothetical protein